MKLRFALFILLLSASVVFAQTVRQTITLRKMSLPDTAGPPESVTSFLPSQTTSRCITRLSGSKSRFLR